MNKENITVDEKFLNEPSKHMNYGDELSLKIIYSLFPEINKKKQFPGDCIHWFNKESFIKPDMEYIRKIKIMRQIWLQVMKRERLHRFVLCSYENGIWSLCTGVVPNISKFTKK